MAPLHLIPVLYCCSSSVRVWHLKLSTPFAQSAVKSDLPHYFVWGHCFLFCEHNYCTTFNKCHVQALIKQNTVWRRLEEDSNRAASVLCLVFLHCFQRERVPANPRLHNSSAGVRLAKYRFTFRYFHWMVTWRLKHILELLNAFVSAVNSKKKKHLITGLL